MFSVRTTAPVMSPQSERPASIIPAMAAGREITALALSGLSLSELHMLESMRNPIDFRKIRRLPTPLVPQGFRLFWPRHVIDRVKHGDAGQEGVPDGGRPLLKVLHGRIDDSVQIMGQALSRVFQGRSRIDIGIVRRSIFCSDPHLNIPNPGPLGGVSTRHPSGQSGVGWVRARSRQLREANGIGHLSFQRQTPYSSE